MGSGSTDCEVFKKGTQNHKIILAKNEHTQRKLVNFENWSKGELSKIKHHFRKYNLKLDVLKKCQLQKM